MRVDPLSEQMSERERVREYHRVVFVVAAAIGACVAMAFSRDVRACVSLPKPHRRRVLWTRLSV